MTKAHLTIVFLSTHLVELKLLFATDLTQTLRKRATNMARKRGERKVSIDCPCSLD